MSIQTMCFDTNQFEIEDHKERLIQLENKILDLLDIILEVKRELRVLQNNQTVIKFIQGIKKNEDKQDSKLASDGVTIPLNFQAMDFNTNDKENNDNEKPNPI